MKSMLLADQREAAPAQVEGADRDRVARGAGEAQVAAELRVDAAPAHEDPVRRRDGEVEGGVEGRPGAPALGLRLRLRGEARADGGRRRDVAGARQRLDVDRELVGDRHVEGDDPDPARHPRRAGERARQVEVEIRHEGHDVARQKLGAGRLDPELPGPAAVGRDLDAPAHRERAAVAGGGGELVDRQRVAASADPPAQAGQADALDRIREGALRERRAAFQPRRPEGAGHAPVDRDPPGEPLARRAERGVRDGRVGAPGDRDRQRPGRVERHAPGRPELHGRAGPQVALDRRALARKLAAQGRVDRGEAGRAGRGRGPAGERQAERAAGRGGRARQGRLAVEGSGQAEARAQDVEGGERKRPHAEIEGEPFADLSRQGDAAGLGGDDEARDGRGAALQRHGGRLHEGDPAAAALGRERCDLDPGRPVLRQHPGGAFEREAPRPRRQGDVARGGGAGRREPDRFEGLAARDEPVGLEAPVQRQAAVEVRSREVRVEPGELDRGDPQAPAGRHEPGVLAPVGPGEGQRGVEAAAEPRQQERRQAVEVRRLDGEAALREPGRVERRPAGDVGGADAQFEAVEGPAVGAAQARLPAQGLVADGAREA